MKILSAFSFFLRSRRAGERVMALLRRLYATLRLKVNEAKSAVTKVLQEPHAGWYGIGGSRQ